MTTAEIAELMYRSYGDEAGWFNQAGNPMPSWRELPTPQRAAWEAAAAAVTRAICSGRPSPNSAYAASHPDGPGPDPRTVDPNRALPVADEPTGCSGPCTGSNTGGRA
jgi:hypothetical protein